MRTQILKPFISGLLLAALIIAFGPTSTIAQIKIGTNGTTIAPASLLELESANQGLLLPRMDDTVAINALNPPNGMLIYLTKVPAVGLYVRKVTGWEYLTGSLGGNGNFNSLTVAGTITAGNFSGPLNGNATSANTSVTSTNSLKSTVINDLATGQPTYPIFVTQTPGNAQMRTSTTKLSFVPNTGILTAVGFNGPLVGDVTGNASSATNATNASNTDIVDDVSTNAVQYPTFVSGTTGNLPQKTSSTNLSYTPQTGELKALRFLGNLTGNASSSDNAITTAITNDNLSGATVYPTFVTNTSGNWGQRTAGTKLTFVPATGLLTASSFSSTVPTGTAPFFVASSTTVANLSATNSLNANITEDVATAVSVFPTFVTGTSGNQNQRVASSRLSFIPSTGALSATSFVGPLNGNATSATSAVNATNSANSANSLISDDITTPTVAYPVFVNGTPGNQPLRTGTTNISYRPATGILTAKGFNGPLVGNVTGTSTAAIDAENTVNMRITDDVISNIPVYPTFVSGTSGPLPSKVSSTKLSFTPSSGELVAPVFRGAFLGNASTATAITGNVAAVNGGTGQTSFTPGDILYASTSNALSKLSIGAPNSVLRVSGANIPFWSTAGAGTVTSITGTSNKIIVSNADNTIAPILDIAPTYVGQNSITTVGTITNGVWNGTAVPVTSGGTGLATLPTALLVGNGTLPMTTVTGTAGHVLTSTGPTTAPVFQASGGGDMILVTPQTVTGTKTFDFNKLVSTGVAGRTTTINASTGVGTSTVELPPDGIIVNRDRTETLLNKTLDNPILNAPIIGVATGTSLTTTGNLTAPVLVSTVGTGVAPLTINSTTPVPNLSILGNAATASTAVNFSGTLLGDVIGTQGSTVVGSVGGISATGPNSINLGVTAANNATAVNLNNRIVLRDGSNNFAAGTITASLNGNATTATSATTATTAGTVTNPSQPTITSVGTLTGLTVTNPITGNITGNSATANTAVNFTGSLIGDVTGNQGSTVVSSVGGITASTINIGVTAANNATSANINNTIVLRDGSNNFSAGTITAALNGNANTVTTIPSLSGEVTNSGNTVTLSNAAVITKLVGVTYTTATTPVSAADNIIQAIGKVEGNANLKAPLNSPSFTGTVVIPVPYTLGATPVSTTGTQLNYLNIANGVTGTTKVVLADSPTFTGTPTLPTGTIGTTQLAGNNTTALATTAFVTTADALKANIASPAFTGTVGIPSPFTLGGTPVTTNAAQLNFLNVASGTTGTTNTNLVFSESPTLTTPILGVATVLSISGNSPTPTKLAGGGITLSSVSGTNLSGSIQITSDGSGSGNAVLLTLTYSGLTFPTNSYPVLVPASPETAALIDANKIWVKGNQGNFQIMSGTSTLPLGTYKWYYMVSGN